MRTISYDFEAAGHRVITIPSELPFSDHLDDLRKLRDFEQRQKHLSAIAESGNPYEVSAALTSRLIIEEHPHFDLLTVLHMAGSGDPAGIRLLYASMLAVQPATVMIGKMADFHNIRRVMDRIHVKKQKHAELSEAEEWFSRKVMLLSMAQKLPETTEYDAERPWHSWSEGVRRALSEADDKWDEAVSERAKAEIEALDMKIRSIVASLDPGRRAAIAIYLGSMSEENSFRMRAIDESIGEGSSDPLILRRGLENIWENVISSLRESVAGNLLADMFDAQAQKTHTLPQLRAGASLIRSLNMHPEIRKVTGAVDLPSCLYQFIMNAGDGMLEAMVPKGTRLDALRESSGFELEGEVLRVDLARISRGSFVDEDGMPIDVDWTLATLDKELSYKSLVMCYMDNDSFLVELLNNPKAISKPGIVDLIAKRCRSLRVLSLVANRRELFTGYVNKNVPLNLLMNPAKIPLTSIRKFVHVRYVDKMTLQRLTGRGGNIREEVRREIQRYLNTSH
jgi:hypothetical protein